MLNKLELIELAEETTKKFIEELKSKNEKSRETKIEILTYLKVLNDRGMIRRYENLTINIAQELLLDLNDMK